MGRKELLEELTAHYERRCPGSKDLFKEYGGTLIGGGSHNLRLFSPFPFYDSVCSGAKVTGVSLSDGRHIPADLIVVGVGVLPNVELAAEAGLRVASGIIVNDHLLTADENISAIGDCALYASQRFAGSLRLESVQNATDHARCVAARLPENDLAGQNRGRGRNGRHQQACAKNEKRPYGADEPDIAEFY